MWRSALGKSGDKQDGSSSSKRKNSEARTPQRTGSDPTYPSTTSSQKPSRGDDRDRGFNPSSTSYSSSSRAPYPGTASASVASSYATAQPNGKSETNIAPPDLVRNSSLVDKMPKSRSSRDDRDRGDSERKSGRSRRDRSSSRDRKSSRRDQSRSEDRGSRVSGDKKEQRTKRRSTTDGSYEDTKTRTRAGDEANFNAQISGAAFSQFPGQYDGGLPSQYQSAQSNAAPMSNHVPDMFPGQFPDGSTGPYRPPLAASEGGPGLAADYYGDAGQSVHHQPGVRPQTPDLIVGAEPHLMAASAVAAPPQEPSATGGIGAAHAFFSSGASFGTPSNSQGPSPAASPGMTATQAPSGHQSFSSAISPMSGGAYGAPIGAAGAGAAAGAAAGYMMNGGSSSQHQQSFSADYSSRPPRPITNNGRLDSFSGSSKPPKPGASPRHSPSNHNFAVAAGAAGLAAAAYHHTHHNNRYSPSQEPYPSPYGQNGGQVMAHKHRHKGPFSALLDFFRDPDGVAEFEEYTEYIGVCRYCFEPGTSARDAPRKHHYKRRRSYDRDRYGSSTRIDKTDRYWTSDTEGRRKGKGKAAGLVGAGVAGYGIAQLGKSMFGNNRDFDDTYSVRTGRNNLSSSSVNLPRRYSPDRKSRSQGVITVEEESTSRPALEYRVGGKGHAARRERSRSRDRKTGLGDAALGAAAGATIAGIASSSRKRDKSPKGAFLRRRSSSSSSSTSKRNKSRRSRKSSSKDAGIFGGFFSSLPPNKRVGHKKQRSTGFFNFGNSSSSSSESALAFGIESDRSRRRKSSIKSGKIKNTSDANAALIGLAAAGTALAAAKGHSDSSRTRLGNVVAVKKEKGKGKHDERKRNEKRRYSDSAEEAWESASEDDNVSVDSALAFGVSSRRSSSSLSDASGTSKWGWRWGSKKKRSPSPRRDRRYEETAAAGIGFAGAAAGAAYFKKEHDRKKVRDSSTSLPPMRNVYPDPLSETSALHNAHRQNEIAPGQPLVSRPTPIPIQQPQPVPAVSPSVYNSKGSYDVYQAPTGPPVFSQEIDRRERYDTPDNKSRETTSEKKSRRKSSPPPEEGSKLLRRSTRDKDSSVRFDFTKEEEKMQREKDERRERRSSRRDSDSRSDRKRLEEDEDSERRSSKSKRDSRSSRDDRDEDDEANRRIEMINIDDEPTPERKKEKRRSKDGSSWTDPALAGIATAAVGAAIASSSISDSPQDRREKRREERRRDSDSKPRVYTEEKSRQEEKPSRSSKGSDFASIVGAAADGSEAASATSKYDERRERRREERRSQSDDKVAESFTAEPREMTLEEHEALVDAQNRKIAKRAAALVRNTPSPVHENYSTFFAPDDIINRPAGTKERAGDPNADNDIQVFEVPQIVTVEPKEPKTDKASLVGLEKFLEDEHWYHDPRTLSMMGVPHLNLINPTPPGSRAPSRAGLEMKEESRTAPAEKSSERRAKSPGKVTFGGHTTREYEVVTPEEHREEFIESEHSDKRIQDETRRDKPAREAKVVESPVEEVSRDHIPGAFGDDIDFTATVAAGLEDTGFDPNIVINDPNFHRRDSPPGSNEPGPKVYQQPFYETVEDLGIETAAAGLASAAITGINQQHGWVEDEELPPSPEDEKKPISRSITEDDDSKLSKKDRKKKEKEEKRRFRDQDHFPEENGNALEDPDDAEMKILNEASREQPDERESSKSRKKEKKSKGDRTSSEDRNGSPPKENDTFEDAHAEYASHRDYPEDISAAGVPLPHNDAESSYSTVSRRSGTDESRADDDDVYESPNEYAASAVSAPATGYFDETPSRKHRKKRRSTRDDDTASIASTPAKIDESKLKDKKKTAGGIFGLFSKSVDDAAEKRKAKEAEAAREEEEAKRKKKSKRRSRDSGDLESLASQSVVDLSRVDDDDTASVKSSSRRKSRDKDEKRRSRRGSQSDGESGRSTRDKSDKVQMFQSSVQERIVSFEDANKEQHADEVAARSGDLGEIPPDRRSRHENDIQGSQSFLGERQRPTEPPDISSYGVEDDVGTSGKTQRRSSSSPTGSRALSPVRVEGAKDDSFLPEFGAPLMDTPADGPRRLSMLQSDSTLPPGSQMSPTAVPLLFRRPPGLGSRSVSSSPLASPSMTKPRSKRPQSTEFKSNEFRPLFLVERHRAKQDVDPEEVLPSLPSSHSTSRASSIHSGDEGDFPRKKSPKFQGAPLDLESSRDQPLDVLDSQQTTPTAASFNQKREQDLLEQARQEAISNEIEWNQRHSGEFQGRDSKRNSAALARDVGLAVAMGGAAVTAATALGSDEAKNESQDRDLPITAAQPTNQSEDTFADKEHPLDQTSSIEKEESPASKETTNDFDFPTSKKEMKKKAKKDRKTSLVTEPELSASASNDVLGLDSSATGGEDGVQRPTAEERRRYEEQDTQDAMDTLFGPVTPTLKLEVVQGSRSLSKDMSTEDVAATFASVAAPDKETELESPRSPPVPEALLNRSALKKSKKKGKKSRQTSLVGLDDISSAPSTVIEEPREQVDTTSATEQMPMIETLEQPRGLPVTGPAEDVPLPSGEDADLNEVPKDQAIETPLVEEAATSYEEPVGIEDNLANDDDNDSTFVETGLPDDHEPISRLESLKRRGLLPPDFQIPTKPHEPTQESAKDIPIEREEIRKAQPIEELEVREVSTEPLTSIAAKQAISAEGSKDIPHVSPLLEGSAAKDELIASGEPTSVIPIIEEPKDLNQQDFQGKDQPIAEQPRLSQEAHELVEPPTTSLEPTSHDLDAPEGPIVTEVSPQDAMTTEPASSSAPAPIIEEPLTAPAGNADQEPTDDFFSFTPAKKGKKGKKGKKSQASQDEDFMEAEKALEEAAPVETPSEIPAESAIPAEASIEDEWAAPKSKKKGKKGKKGQLETPAEPETPIVEPDFLETEKTLEDAVSVEPSAEALIDPIISAEANVEDEWAPSKSKKKGKKGKKIQPETPTDLAMPHVEESDFLDTQKSLEAVPVEVPTEAPADAELSTEVPADPNFSTEALIEHEWAPTKSKKGKKGKKSQPETPAEPETLVEEPDFFEAEKSSEEPIPAESSAEATADPDFSIQASVEDEWAPSKSKKKGKKGKKNQPETPAEPVTPVVEEPFAEKLNGEALAVDTNRGLGDIATPEPLVEPHVQPEVDSTNLEEPVVEDGWALPSSSKKKGKKNKKQSASETDTSALLAGAAVGAGAAVILAENQGSENLAPEQATSAETDTPLETSTPAEPAGEDDWGSSTTSKKKGKKSKKRAQESWEPEPELDQPAVERAEQSKTEDVTRPLDEPIATAEGPTTHDQEPALVNEEPTISTEESRAIAENFPPNTEESVVPVNQEPEVAQDTLQERVATAEESQIPVKEPINVEQPHELHDVPPPESASVEPAATEEPAAEDDWGFSTKKKGKKSKKGKKVLETPDPEVVPEAEAEVSPSKPAEAQTLAKQTIDDGSNFLEDESLSQPIVPEEQAAEDEWALPSSSKKGKKGKKGKKVVDDFAESEISTDTPVEVPAGERFDERPEPTAEVTETIIEPQTSAEPHPPEETAAIEPAPEDEWGSFATKKKKGKKGKKAQETAVFEPAAETFENKDASFEEPSTTDPSGDLENAPLADEFQAEPPMTTEPAPEDEWGGFTATKKKGKKSKKKAQEFFDPEPEPVTETAEVIESSIPAMTEEPRDFDNAAQPEKATSAAPALDDEWAAPSKKKGKKDKKKAIESPAPEPESLPTETTEPTIIGDTTLAADSIIAKDIKDQPITTEEAAFVPAADIVSRSVEQAPAFEETFTEPAHEKARDEAFALDEPAIEDEWTAPASKKKGKKGKKKQQQQEQEMQFDPEQPETVQPSVSDVAEPTSTQLQSEAEITAKQPLPKDIIPDDEWADAAPKKGKKGKKTKKGAKLDWEEEALVPGTSLIEAMPAEEQLTEPLEDVSTSKLPAQDYQAQEQGQESTRSAEDVPMVDLPTTEQSGAVPPVSEPLDILPQEEELSLPQEAETTFQQPSLNETAAEDDEWAPTSSKKKGKNGKKGKPIAFELPEEPPLAEEPEAVSREMGEAQQIPESEVQQTETPAEDEWGVLSKKKKGKKGRKAMLEPEVGEQATLVEPSQETAEIFATAEPEPVEDFSAPVSKKDKKKKKKSQALAWEEAESQAGPAEAPAEELSSQMVETEQQEARDLSTFTGTEILEPAAEDVPKVFSEPPEPAGEPQQDISFQEEGAHLTTTEAVGDDLHGETIPQAPLEPERSNLDDNVLVNEPADVLEKPSEPILDEGEPSPGEFAFTTSKSKKDKKKSKKQKVSEFLEDGDQSTPTEMNLIGTDVRIAEAQLPELSDIRESESEPSRDVEPETTKGKKKKRGKGKKADDDLWGNETGAEVSTSIESTNPVDTFAEPIAEYQAETSKEIQLEEAPSVDEALEFSTSKSEKDKKKTKKASQATASSWDEEPAQQAATEPEPDPESKPALDVPQPGRSQEIAPEVLLESQDAPAGDVQPEPKAVEEFFEFSKPKSKKDKKKAKKATGSTALAWDEEPVQEAPVDVSAVELPLPGHSEEGSRETSGDVSAVLPESISPAGQPEESQEFSTSKSKKDKKKAKKAKATAFDWDEQPSVPEVEASTPAAEPFTVDPMQPSGIAPVQAEAEFFQDVPMEEASAIEAPSKFQEPVSKKDKKKTKKAKQAAFDCEDGTAARPADIVPETETVAREEKSKELEVGTKNLALAEPTEQLITAPEEESWSTGKKGNKKGKKNKAVHFSWDEPTTQGSTETATPAEPVSKIEESQDLEVSLTEAPIGESVKEIEASAPEEESWASGKKSKKKGKKGKSTAFDWNEEPGSQALTEPATPAEPIATEFEPPAFEPIDTALAEQVTETPEDEAWSTEKSSKKAMKKSQRLSTLDWAEESEKAAAEDTTEHRADDKSILATEQFAEPEPFRIDDSYSQTEDTNVEESEQFPEEIQAAQATQDYPPTVEQSHYELSYQAENAIDDQTERGVIEATERPASPLRPETTEASTEDFASFPSKKSKKDKKKSKQSSGVQTAQETDIPTFESTPLTKEPLAGEGLSEDVTAGNDLEATPETSLSRKQSKKKGKKQQTLAWDEPVETQELGISEDPSVPVEPVEPPSIKDNFEAFDTKKSKKDKKKTKKAQEFNWDDEPETVKAADDVAERTIEETAAEQMLVEKPLSSKDVQEFEAPLAESNEPAVLSQEATPAVEQPEDDFTGFTSKKKGKKGKKARAAVEEDWPTEVEQDKSVEEQSIQETARDETSREEHLTEQATGISPPVTDDDDWAAFGAVKSKKGKKKNKKQDRPVVWGDETATPPIESESQPIEPIVKSTRELPVEPQPVLNSAPGSWEHQDADRQEAWDDPQPEAAGRATEEPSRQVEEVTEASWDAPVSRKKSKKGKKKQQAFEDLEESAPTTQVSEEVIQKQPSTISVIDEEASSSRDVPGDAKPHSKRTGSISAAAGIAMFEQMSRSDSKSEGKSSKKKTKSSRSAWNESEPNPQFQDDAPATDAYRDSALQMESPHLPEHARFADESIRDSGYQGTEASPVIPEQPVMSVERGISYGVEDQQAPKDKKRRHRQFEMPQDSYPSPSPVSNKRDPSPVDSTSKDRSAHMLFGSSPSTRQEPSQQQHTQYSSIDEVAGSAERSARRRSRSPEQHEEDRSRSIFGGPVGINSDEGGLRSPPRTPAGFAREATPLETITEHSPDDLRHHKRGHSIIDVGQPEHGVKAARRQGTPITEHRVHSPAPGHSARQLGHISTDDMLSKLDWPDIDEDREIVDLERSMSRNTEKDRRASGRHSKPSPLSADKQREGERRSLSGASIRSNDSINAIIRSPQEAPHSATPPLRRTDRSASGDLRAASRLSAGSSDASTKRDRSAKSEPKAKRNLDGDEVIASSSTYDPVTDKGKGRISKMADVYEGWGDVHGSPRSPTRPPSMRRRQSMQILDLETRLDQLASENRLLQDAKARAERGLDEAVHDRDQQNQALTEALQTRDQYLQQKDEELESLRETLHGLQDHVTHLNEVNAGLTTAATVGGAAAVAGMSRGDDSDYEQRYMDLEAEYSESRQQWEENHAELEELRNKHASLSGGMEGIVRQEVQLALRNKDAELQQVRAELEAAQRQIRSLQQQILAARSSDDGLVTRDEDYFDAQCQQLCRHVEQWVLRFSKFSDMKVCRSINDVSDEKISDRYDNAMLDGTDVDTYLRDRVKRRDVFMSVVMMMVWEHVFTRYLFGMDREQRSKLKKLEKTLSEVASPSAVNKWRATTLSMLCKRDAFQEQRANDTEAVVEELYDTLSALLTPPSHLVQQIKDSLTKVMSTAVDLSIEMRTQRAEYIMLPVLQPEYDTNGDLAQKVHFNSSLMSERGGNDSSNEELAASSAIVRLVVFPPVVKRGDENGNGNAEEQIVVYPAQVMIANDSDRKGKKSVRVISAQGNRSVGSFAPSQMEGGMF